jgi:hypothetical protein
MMEQIGGTIVLFGFLTIIISQFIVFLKALSHGKIYAFFCLVMPFYIIFYMRRKETRMQKTLFAWYGGFLLIAIGAMIASIR